MARSKSVNPQTGQAVQGEQAGRPGRKPREVRRATPEQPPASGANKNAGSQEISPEERKRMIEEAAYYCAQRRQSEGGYSAPDEDWAEAEAQIDQMLKERRNKNQD